MDRLDRLEVFARVARLGSFSAAARALGRSPTAVSRAVATLEAELGASLLRRTTRSLSLTPHGRGVLERAEALVGDWRELAQGCAQDATPQGRLRITASTAFARAWLAPVLVEFAARWPAVDLDVLLTDAHVDLVAQDIDVALRLGVLADSSYIARKLAPLARWLCASPTYLAGAAPLRHPDDLGQHRCLVDTNPADPWHWVLTRPPEAARVPVTGRLVINEPFALRQACEAGLGLAMLPDFVAGPALRAGTLVRALPEWAGPTGGLYAVYPQRRQLSAAVRGLVAHVEAALTGGPPWRAPAVSG